MQYILKIMCLIGMFLGLTITATAAVQNTAMDKALSLKWQLLTGSVINGVKCVSENNCFAVGTLLKGPNTTQEALILNWNGNVWSVMPSPNPGSDSNSLESISCISDRNCIAVGSYKSSSTAEQNLVVKWDGNVWSFVPTPNPAGIGNDLSSVTCVSDTSCVAVGFNWENYTKTFIMRLKGTTWSVDPSPSSGNTFNNLLGVSCVSETDCVAVGVYWNQDYLQKTLILSWNGNSWSAVSSPNPSRDNNSLDSVSCTKDNNCVAVGEFSIENNIFQTLTLKRNGSTWTVMPSPSPGTISNTLSSVSCTDANNCNAIGSSIGPNNSPKNLILNWNGNVWNAVQSPNPGSLINLLRGISCSSPTHCIAIGNFANLDDTHGPMFLQRNGNVWSVMRSPSEI